MLTRAATRPADSHVKATVHLGSAERLPLAERSYDPVVFTLTLCTVQDVATALNEAARVLRPTGGCFFSSTFAHMTRGLARCQGRLARLQRLFSNGCNEPRHP